MAGPSANTGAPGSLPARATGAIRGACKTLLSSTAFTQRCTTWGLRTCSNGWAVGQNAVILGEERTASATWATQFDGSNVEGSLPLFALSVVSGQINTVPEPSSLVTALIGGVSVAVVMALRTGPGVPSSRRSGRTVEC